MNSKELFYEMMEQQQEIALATSVDGQPNVRIVNFLYSPERKVVYFSTFEDNDKIKEIESNPKVAFTTVITGDEHNHVRVLAGTAKKSDLTLNEIGAAFIEKFPFYEENIKFAGDQLILFEIGFEKATVILGMETREEITV